MLGRPCDVSEVLKDLVGAAVALAYKQNRKVELIGTATSLLVSVEESALRRALSNLIDGALLRTQIGGQVKIFADGAPAGGALVVIDDDGPDVHYLVMSNFTNYYLGQNHSCCVEKLQNGSCLPRLLC